MAKNKFKNYFKRKRPLCLTNRAPQIAPIKHVIRAKPLCLLHKTPVPALAPLSPSSHTTTPELLLHRSLHCYSLIL